MPNVPASTSPGGVFIVGGLPAASYSTSRRPTAALQGSVDQDSPPYSMAHSSSRWSAHRLGASTPREQAIRLSSSVQAGQQRAVGMLQDSATLSRYPVRSGSVSGHLGRPLVDLLPCAQERHRQDARLCRPAADERVHQVRALQDGRAPHSRSNAPPQRLHDEDRHQRLLSPLSPPTARQPIHAVHVGGGA